MSEKLSNVTKILTDGVDLDYPPKGLIIPPELDQELELDYTDYVSHCHTEDISFVELAIINEYLHTSYSKSNENNSDLVVNAYGYTDSIGRLSYNGDFNATSQYWFMIQFNGDDNEFIVQTKMYFDNDNRIIVELNLTCKKGLKAFELMELVKKIKSLSFNNSKYKGKCVKIKLIDGRFKKIEIIDTNEKSNELILTDVQKKWVDHFIARIEKGGNARYLFNGIPGCGKTEVIRKISSELYGKATFIIPEFSTNEDLTMIMEASSIFNKYVIIMDDIDLYLGSRDNGSYTRLLGQFLSFFDGVKKRKVSLLASTNDKGLVDKAAERPGRFNFTLDFSYLTDDQIRKVCKIHLPEKWQTEEIYLTLLEDIDGKKPRVTGAFIANLGENIKEMSEDSPEWNIQDTKDLIIESYKGFYSSQVKEDKKSLGFV